MKKLPVYKLRIKEDDASKSSVDFVALVDDPAIQLDWQTFGKKQQFAADVERRIITGAFMVANMPIYRRDEKLGEYYVVFDSQEIEKIVFKFFRNGFTSHFNIMHDPNQVVDGVYLFESFLIDEKRGIKPPDAFKDIADGSWLASVKIDNDQVWNDFVKTGQLKGFSVEGLFNYEQVDPNSDEQVLKEIAEIVKGN